jgi:hypothetical protein
MNSYLSLRYSIAIDITDQKILRRYDYEVVFELNLYIVLHDRVERVSRVEKI